MRYQKVNEVPEGEHGKRFIEGEAPVVDWRHGVIGKYYRLCRLLFKRGDEKTFHVTGDIIKVRYICPAAGYTKSMNPTWVYVKKFSFYTNNITQVTVYYDDDLVKDDHVLWQLSDEEVIEFKQLVKSLREKQINDF